MSQKQLYQLYDTEAQMAGGPIMAVPRANPAIREFHTVLADQNTQPGRYPEHFELRYLGNQNEETGEITPQSPPTVVATGIQWVEANRRSQQAARPPASEMFTQQEIQDMAVHGVTPNDVYRGR